jgi:cysteine synthase
MQIYLKGLSKKTGSKIYGKAEFQNPGGSVKDRAALGIIEAAEADGRCVQPSSSPSHAIYRGKSKNLKS